MSEQRINTTNGTETVLQATALEQLQDRLRGELLRPGDDGYDGARTIHNGMIDRRPALIVRCAGVADVIAAVTFARDHQLLVAVRGGGHGVPGFAVCDGGLMIDLSRMKGVRVDPARRTARAEGGATWGDFDHETQAFGLATTGGDCPPDRHRRPDARRRPRLPDAHATAWPATTSCRWTWSPPTAAC